MKHSFITVLTELELTVMVRFLRRLPMAFVSMVLWVLSGLQLPAFALWGHLVQLQSAVTCERIRLLPKQTKRPEPLRTPGRGNPKVVQHALWGHVGPFLAMETHQN